MTENKEGSFAELFAAAPQKRLQKLSPGQKITATIVGIDNEVSFLDVGSKSEGILESAEIKDDEGNFTHQVGDRLDVYFLQTKRAEQIFTTTLGSGSSTAHLEEAFRARIPVEGMVKAEIKGGFEIRLGGNVRGFCPYSQMGVRRVDDAAKEYLGSRMTFLITRFSENGRNIVLSARAIQEEERERQKEKLKEQLEEGQTISGTITSIRDFGAFVDIGGVDGLIPISEIGWSRIDKIDEYFSIGQQVEVLVKEIDWQKERISLSYKATQKDPFEKVRETYPEGSLHTGTVARLSQFGAFVTLEPGIDGLVHISKLGGGKRIHHPSEVLDEGQSIEVRVEQLNMTERKMSLVPSDYVSEASEQEREQRIYKDFIAKERQAPEKAAMGSLGKLLQAKLSEKKQG
ncbi:MAG: 30S ribosomal protein S1 [Deltaproteobacteria bacterium]|nr:MAG: 30S ribosomal protein S1 [Deltaproteobacteria bacterium]